MTSRRDAFYAERDRRTRQYGGTDNALERPVLIVVGSDIAGTRAGQIASLALVNMAVRVHRRVGLVIPDAPLRTRSLVPADDFRTAVIRTAYAINPVLDLYLDADIETKSFEVSVGLGAQTSGKLDLYLDWHGGLGTLATTPIAVPALDPQSVFGAATAAVLGAAGLFRLVHGQPIRPARINPIELAADADAGTGDYTGPIDVGTILVAGAGAVTTALLYWAREQAPAVPGTSSTRTSRHCTTPTGA